MNSVRLSSLPILERRKNDVRDAKISLIAEHKSRDALIQDEIRQKYSLSEEIAMLRKEIDVLRDAIMQLLQIDTLGSDVSDEFTAYSQYVEQCKSIVSEQENIQLKMHLLSNLQTSNEFCPNTTKSICPM